MMSSQHIIEVNEANFQTEVLAFSNTTPVVVDFWADWCQPCHMLTPILERLANEHNGAFRLAKINADENPNLTMQFDIRGLPTVKAFDKGQVAAEFVGAQTEGKVREFLSKIAPSELSLALEKGHSLIQLGNWEEAVDSFRKVLKSSPDNGGALLGMAKSLLAQGNPGDALVILREFPTSKELTTAEQLLPLAHAMAQIEMEEQTNGDDELDNAYSQAVRLVKLGNLPAAADGLLDILKQDKNYRQGEVKKVILGVLEIMGESAEETRKYRNELTSILF